MYHLIIRWILGHGQCSIVRWYRVRDAHTCTYEAHGTDGAHITRLAVHTAHGHGTEGNVRTAPHAPHSAWHTGTCVAHMAHTAHGTRHTHTRHTAHGTRTATRDTRHATRRTANATTTHTLTPECKVCRCRTLCNAPFSTCPLPMAALWPLMPADAVPADAPPADAPPADALPHHHCRISGSCSAAVVASRRAPPRRLACRLGPPPSSHIRGW